MAHFVGKILHIRPNEILDTWGVPELIVAFGEYANDISQRNYEEYRHMSPQDRAKIERPNKYAVKFYSLEEE